jgi:hypothetical protein
VGAEPPQQPHPGHIKSADSGFGNRYSSRPVLPKDGLELFTPYGAGHGRRSAVIPVGRHTPRGEVWCAPATLIWAAQPYAQQRNGSRHPLGVTAAEARTISQARAGPANGGSAATRPPAFTLGKASPALDHCSPGLDRAVLLRLCRASARAARLRRTPRNRLLPGRGRSVGLA